MKRLIYFTALLILMQLFSACGSAAGSKNADSKSSSDIVTAAAGEATLVASGPGIEVWTNNKKVWIGTKTEAEFTLEFRKRLGREHYEVLCPVTGKHVLTSAAGIPAIAKSANVFLAVGVAPLIWNELCKIAGDVKPAE